MRNNESLLDKLRAQERGERLLGNHTLADNLLAKIATMENKSGLVPVVQKVDDERRRVEQAWAAMDQTALVDVLCVIPGLARKVRRTMPMSAAIDLLKNGAWLVGRTADLVNVQATTENTPRLVPDAANKPPLYI
jgi:hypothetical protein